MLDFLNDGLGEVVLLIVKVTDGRPHLRWMNMEIRWWLDPLGLLMDLDEQLELNHLFLTDRKCKSCGEVKNLVDGFYRTRKDRGGSVFIFLYL